MFVEFSRLALIFAAGAALSAAPGAQKSAVLPASQAKTHQPATHFTQGTIASIEADHVVISKKVRGKTQETAFAIDAQTQRSGNLAPGARVSVQYRELDGQKVAAAVRELRAEKPPKPGSGDSASKSKS
jgi:hypothetical protein